jgi:hypothetical protein
MVHISKSEREYLEKIGVLKPKNGRYSGMVISSISKKSKGKSVYVEDAYMIYICPDRYRELMKKYKSHRDIENDIRNAMRLCGKK